MLTAGSSGLLVMRKNNQLTDENLEWEVRLRLCKNKVYITVVCFEDYNLVCMTMDCLLHQCCTTCNFLQEVLLESANPLSCIAWITLPSCTITKLELKLILLPLHVLILNKTNVNSNTSNHLWERERERERGSKIRSAGTLSWLASIPCCGVQWHSALAKSKFYLWN